MATVGINEGHDIPDLQVPVVPVRWHAEHEAACVQNICYELFGPAIQIERVKDWEQVLQHDLKAKDGRASFRHDEDEGLGGPVWVGMDGDLALDFDKSGVVNELLGLRVDGEARVGVLDGRNGLGLLLDLVRVVELDVAFQNHRPIIRACLLCRLLQLGVLLLVRRRDDAPAAAPRSARAEADPDPVVVDCALAVENGADVVELLALARDQGARVCLGQARLLEHGEAYAGGPLREGMVRVEVEEVFVVRGGGHAEDVVELFAVLEGHVGDLQYLAHSNILIGEDLGSKECLPYGSPHRSG